jgi:hypothetical protein
MHVRAVPRMKSAFARSRPHTHVPISRADRLQKKQSRSGGVSKIGSWKVFHAHAEREIDRIASLLSLKAAPSLPHNSEV